MGKNGKEIRIKMSFLCTWYVKYTLHWNIHESMWQICEFSRLLLLFGGFGGRGIVLTNTLLIWWVKRKEGRDGCCCLIDAWSQLRTRALIMKTHPGFASFCLLVLSGCCSPRAWLTYCLSNCLGGWARTQEGTVPAYIKPSICIKQKIRAPSANSELSARASIDSRVGPSAVQVHTYSPSCSRAIIGANC